MSRKAAEVAERTERNIRTSSLTDEDRAFLHANAEYEGSAYHKRNPGDFGLTPPSAPRKDKTLCDEAGVFELRVATGLLGQAIDHGLVSEACNALGYPKQFWVVDADGRVFEFIYGGSKIGRYHGYPVRRSDPFFGEVLDAWRQRSCGS